jgi:hypothetical protein
MAEFNAERDVKQAVLLLEQYSFDLAGHPAERLIDYWQQAWESDWIRAAVIESLYQGRYKAVSVEQILHLWGRRGQPVHHFSHEFERIICGPFEAYGVSTTSASSRCADQTAKPVSGSAMAPPSDSLSDMVEPDGTSHPITPFQPTAELIGMPQLEPEPSLVTAPPIGQFVPSTDGSEFDSKLWAVALTPQ